MTHILGCLEKLYFLFKYKAGKNLIAGIHLGKVWKLLDVVVLLFLAQKLLRTSSDFHDE